MSMRKGQARGHGCYCQSDDEVGKVQQNHHNHDRLLTSPRSRMKTTTPDSNDAIYGRLAAWLAVHALGDTGLDADGRALNNIGALSFPDLFAGFCARVAEWVCPLWRCTLGLE